MKFKIKVNEGIKHEEIVNSVSWTFNNELYSISDDNIIYKWDANSLQPTKLMDLETYPTDIDWLPITKGINDIFALSFVDGSYKLITKLAKIEKVVNDAHKGAIICIKWSHDGNTLVTAGEDGQIKTWAKTGLLRGTMVQLESPIYSVKWSPDSEQLLYCCKKNLYIKPKQAGQKQISWKAHDGIILNCDWNASNNLIISCGEDCKYKLWDSYGRLLFTSNPYDYVITSIQWAPNGEYFAVGAYEMLKLCDKTGWTYCFEKTNVGSIMNISWSSDSTICAGAGGNGQIVFGYIYDKTLSKENCEVRLTEDNKIHVQDLINEVNEYLDFKDRVINMSLAYNHLIIITAAQCHIYSVNNWNTPHIFDIKESISLIVQSPKYFCLVMVTNGAMIYNYEGKYISNPKIVGIKFEFLNKTKISLSQDILAIVDTSSNGKSIKFYDIIGGKQLNCILDHTMEIVEINLNQNEIASERKIGYIDVNRDLYLSPTHKRDPIKLCAMTDSFLWNETTDVLAALSDGRLLAWYYPNAIYVDKDLMELCKISKEASEIGRSAQMISFSSSIVTLRRKDGGLITLSISPYPGILYELCEKNKWGKAIKLCRFINDSALWAYLAAISLYCRELETAEISLAAIECVDKVQYINYIKEKLQNEVTKNAALSLYFHKNAEAEQSLLNAKLYYRAIKLNIKLYKWERALDLAIQTKTHLETVLAYRKKYLEQINKDEFIEKFKKYSDQDFDWQEIKAKIKAEKEREAKMR